MKGYIHLYTGNGKGKTTAAIGLAVRAVGATKKVFIAQFVKGMKYSEIMALENFPEITIEQYGSECFIKNQPTQKDIELAQDGFNKVSDIILSNQYDIVILDELNIALYYKLLDMQNVLSVLKSKPEETEIIITGRYATKELYDISDLITEMKEIKHYYNEGVVARKGIEF